MKRRWKVAKAVTTTQLSQFPELDPIIVQLLNNRSITSQKQVEAFLTPDYETDSHDPFLFRDMKKAVERIIVAGENNESVVIYGDYDADGVCASAILKEMFQKVGIDAHVHLPHREKEGYGLNMVATKEFIQKGINLLITCDCGITSFDEISLLKKNNIDVIVTDHHVEPEKMPNAYAILNPSLLAETYPFKKLVGTGVVFKLAQAVYTTLREKGEDILQGEEKWLLDLVAIATIADYGPLRDENRTFTKYGLIVLEKTKRQGLQDLLSYVNGNAKHLNSETIAFQVVPRLNAASRMDHANVAFNLLVEENPVESFTLAEELNRLNQERQKVSERMFTESKKQIEEQKDDNILIAVGDGWSAGIVGLVAGKLHNTYRKPVLVIGMHGDEIVGSGRSPDVFDITAALKKSSAYLEKFGGHPQACGFTIKKGALENFKKSMRKEAEKIPKGKLVKQLAIDAEISLNDVNWKLWDVLDQFGPFGEGNPQPVFASKGVVVEDVRVVGNSGKHMQVHVSHGSEKIHKTIAFGFAEEWAEELPQGTAIDIAYEISVNEWNGNRELQLKLVDIKK